MVFLFSAIAVYVLAELHRVVSSPASCISVWFPFFSLLSWIVCNICAKIINQDPYNELVHSFICLLIPNLRTKIWYWMEKRNFSKMNMKKWGWTYNHFVIHNSRLRILVVELWWVDKKKNLKSKTWSKQSWIKKNILIW